MTPGRFPPSYAAHGSLCVTSSFHISYPFPLPSQLIRTLYFILTAWLFPIPQSPGEAGMSSADVHGWAVAMAVVKHFKRDLKHCSCSGGSGPPSSWSGLKQVIALGNGALLSCQMHGALAFPEHVRCKPLTRAWHTPVPITSSLSRPPRDPFSGWALPVLHSPLRSVPRHSDAQKGFYLLCRNKERCLSPTSARAASSL